MHAPAGESQNGAAADAALRDRVAHALRSAKRGDDSRRRAMLLLLAAAIRDRDAAARARDDQGQAKEGAIRDLLATMIRQREESADLYEQGGRLEMAENEREEARIIAEFLPVPLNRHETWMAVETMISETGARSLRDMGAVMGRLGAAYGARIDMPTAARMARSILNF